eukprot:3061929-Prymnesium_polylepis.1
MPPHGHHARRRDNVPQQTNSTAVESILLESSHTWNGETQLKPSPVEVELGGQSPGRERKGSVAVIRRDSRNRTQK